MPELRLNLLRGQVPSLRQRRGRYLGMLVYLAVGGTLLAAVLALSTARYVRATLLRDELASLESSFDETHPGTGGIAAYASQIEQVLERRVAALRAVERQLGDCPRPAPMAFWLADSLPSGVSLHSLELDAGAGTAAFELLVSAQRAEGGAGAPELTARWNQDERVTAHLSEVSYLGSQRQAGGASEDVLWRFSARLAKGGP
jgi:hypothetical protein